MMPRLSLSLKRKPKNLKEKTENKENNSKEAESTVESTIDYNEKNETLKPRKNFKKSSLRRFSLKKIRRSRSAPKPLEQKKIEKREISLPQKVDDIKSSSKETGYRTMSQKSPILLRAFNSEPDEVFAFDMSLRLSNGDIPSENGLLAEAFWDHVTMEDDELSFKAGGIIRVLDMDNPEWWWGEKKPDQGWFPATHVRILVNQHGDVARSDDVDSLKNEEAHEYSRVTTFDDDVNGNRVTSFSAREHVTDDIRQADIVASDTDSNNGDAQLPEIVVSPDPQRARKGSFLRNQMRKNVVNEILNSEKVFLGYLRDVIEGYLTHCKKREDMFTSDEISKLFGNIMQIYDFEKQLISDLESAINRSSIHLSLLGKVFLKHRSGFALYLNYCNNHLEALALLSRFLTEARYVQFFEACRLLQKMVDLSLEKFLLTPVQKISKYPLQLAELLKYTSPDHLDYTDVKTALAITRKFAKITNEKKRKEDNIQKIVRWQSTLHNWQGEDILTYSRELICSGEVYLYSQAKHKMKSRSLFLFDNQLIICKKDVQNKKILHYKTRYCLNIHQVVPVKEKPRLQASESQDPIKEEFSFGWKITNPSSEHSILMFSKSHEDFDKWIKAFSQERLKTSKHIEDEVGPPKDLSKSLLKAALNLPEKPKELSLTRSSSYRARAKTHHHHHHHLHFGKILHSEQSPPDKALSLIKQRSSSLRRHQGLPSTMRENHFIF